MAGIEYLNPDNACPAQGLYSHATLVPQGKTLYLAGQLSVGQTGEVVGVGHFEAQFLQVIENIRLVLASEGLDFPDVVRFTTYLTDETNIDAFMRARKALFPKLFGREPYPPNTLLIVSRLVKPEFLVEIDTVAFARNSDLAQAGA